jgi:hypothetical protein
MTAVLPTRTSTTIPARTDGIRGLAALALLVMGLVPRVAAAQTINNVNDCTLLTDPVSLRRCVDSFAGRIQKPSDQLLSPSADVVQPPVEGRSNTSPAIAAPKAGAPGRVNNWLPEAGKPGGVIRSNPNSIVFDR